MSLTSDGLILSELNEYYLVVSRKNIKPIHPNLNMSNILIPNVQTQKHLGIHLSSDGSWDYHINSISQKAWKKINVMRQLKIVLIESLCKSSTFHLFDQF